MGVEVPNPPKYSAIAHYALSAFRTIERSRHYFDAVPKPIDAQNILHYLELYEAPCPEWLFVECIFALDNLYLEKAISKRKSAKS